MNNKQYITAIAYIILLRIVDLGLTFIYTPNLRYEWNPIVSVFSYSWVGMLITQILIVGLIIAVMSFYFYKKPLSGLPNDLSFNEYIYYYFHNQKRTSSRKWYNLPRQKMNRVLAYNGFILMILVISTSYLAIINNLMVIFKVRSYSNFIIQYGNSLYITILIIMAIFSFILFFILEYRLYKNNLVQVYIND